MPPLVALFGSLIVVVITAWWNTRVLSAQIDALRAEVRQGFAELRLEFHKKTDNLEHRVEKRETNHTPITAYATGGGVTKRRPHRPGPPR